jgi:hypothetical protein
MVALKAVSIFALVIAAMGRGSRAEVKAGGHALEVKRWAMPYALIREFV